jgi:hypothetical protein
MLAFYHKHAYDSILVAYLIDCKGLAQILSYENVGSASRAVLYRYRVRVGGYYVGSQNN